MEPGSSHCRQILYLLSHQGSPIIIWRLGKWQPNPSLWDQGRKHKYKMISFPCGSEGKESTCNAGDPVPGLGRSPGEGNGYPLQSSCLENPMDRGALRATGHKGPWGHKESDMTEYAYTLTACVRKLSTDVVSALPLEEFHTVFLQVT